MKSNKGITMITLVTTIVILTIISSVVITQSINGFKVKALQDFYNDLETIQDKLDIYYMKNGTLPVSGEYTGSTEFKSSTTSPMNPNDNDKYYIINLHAFDGLSLGSTALKNGEDVFIVNEETHTVYYPLGFEHNGEIYYCLDNNYSELD